MDKIQREYLDNFLSSLTQKEREKYHSFSASYFCVDEKNANTCAELILRREKTATCSLKYWYENGLEIMPEVGTLLVVTN